MERAASKHNTDIQNPRPWLDSCGASCLVNESVLALYSLIAFFEVMDYYYVFPFVFILLLNLLLHLVSAY